jgi:hypothetical protein
MTYDSFEITQGHRFIYISNCLDYILHSLLTMNARHGQFIAYIYMSRFYAAELSLVLPFTASYQRCIYIDIIYYECKTNVNIDQYIQCRGLWQLHNSLAMLGFGLEFWFWKNSSAPYTVLGHCVDHGLEYTQAGY